MTPASTSRVSAPVLILLAACGSAPAPAPVAAPAPAQPPQQWEGFFALSAVDQAWLDEQGVPIHLDALERARSRVGRLVLADEERTVPEAELRTLQQRYCEPETTRPWNEAQCASADAAACEEGQCTYRHFGSCSGLFLGQGRFLTAAHCVAALADDEALREASEILPLTSDLRPGPAVRLGAIRAGKHDFDHDWVALGEAQPVDAAVVEVDDGGLPPYPVAAVPGAGDVVLMVGFPRAERRPADARARHGYELVFGTPSVSFGWLADPNPEGHPLCNVDGRQEHWAVTAPCPEGEVTVDGEHTWRGAILAGPFLSTMDSINGYSGAPVFNGQGELVGVNSTIISDENPQEQYPDGFRAVATPIALVKRALSLD